MVYMGLVVVCVFFIASFPVSTPSFFSHAAFFTTCEKKLGVETGNEAMFFTIMTWM